LQLALALLDLHPLQLASVAGHFRTGNDGDLHKGNV
jgi:hypothetical protein